MTFAHDKRPLFAAAALLCYAAAIILAPTGARSQLDSRTRVADVAEARVEPAPPAIAPERDAFAPRASVEDDPPPVLPAAAGAIAALARVAPCSRAGSVRRRVAPRSRS